MSFADFRERCGTAGRFSASLLAVAVAVGAALGLAATLVLLAVLLTGPSQKSGWFARTPAAARVAEWRRLYWAEDYAGSLAAADADRAAAVAAGAGPARRARLLMNAVFPATAALAAADDADAPPPAKFRAAAVDRLGRVAALMAADPAAAAAPHDGNALGRQVVTRAALAVGDLLDGQADGVPADVLALVDAAATARRAAVAAGVPAGSLDVAFADAAFLSVLARVAADDPARAAEARAILDRAAADGSLRGADLVAYYRTRFRPPRGVWATLGEDLPARRAWIADWEAAHPDRPATAVLRCELAHESEQAGYPAEAVALDLETRLRFGDLLTGRGPRAGRLHSIDRRAGEFLWHRLTRTLRALNRDREAAVALGEYRALFPDRSRKLPDVDAYGPRPRSLAPGGLRTKRN